MKEILYEVDGVQYNINQLSETFGISVSTLYRRLKSGLSAEYAVSYKRKVRETPQENNVEFEHDWPDNLILDLLGEEESTKFNMNYIKKNFEANFDFLLEDNNEYFDEKESFVLEEYYKFKRSTNRIAKDLGISRPRVETIRLQIVDTLKKPYFRDYYALGKEFIQKRDSYYEIRENELINELGLKRDELIKKSLANESMENLPLILDKTLAVEISITRLRLSNKAEKALISNDILTINKLLEVSRRDLSNLPGLGHKSYLEIQNAVKKFVERTKHKDE